MNTAEEIRQKVAESYAAAVSGNSGGCCATTCCAGEPGEGAAKADGVTVLAGYTAEDKAGLPADAVQNSFGCGNPLAFSEVREGDVVLDLGSGAGIDLLIASKKVGPSGRVIGVDMTDEMIEHARRNIAEAGATNVEVRKGLIEQLPVESGSVDWVISNCVINLSPEKDKVFAEIARVLKPGGRFQISDIVVKDFPEVLRKSLTLYSACVGGAIGEPEYLEGLREAGLEDVSVQERIVYDAATLRSFVDDELADASAIVDLLNTIGVTGALARYFEGKVWSAKFHGRKPQ